MPYYPTLQTGEDYQRIIDTFLGYNHNYKIGDGEWYDMRNLSSDYYPLLAERRPRYFNSTPLNKPSGLICKDALMYIENGKVMYGGQDVIPSLFLTPADTERTLISMGAYVVIFPDKVYVNTKDWDDWGYLEASATSSNVTVTPCKEDGSSVNATVSSTAPANPTNGQYWVDTSGVRHALKQWSETSGMWITVATTYVSITGLHASTFAKYDGVYIEGLEASSGSTQTQKDQVEALNGSHILYSESGAAIIVGFVDGVVSCTGTVTMKRRVPKMDYITECNNRLWGCYYGPDNGEIVNRIYCCALGDFKNWEKFMGLSTDSYFASIGTDGAFTGAVTVNNMPVFFKEDCLHKVSVSSSGAHQIVDLKCRGVKPGCWKSLAVINEVAYYKASGDVCAYDGAIPQSIGAVFGDEEYTDAWGASLGNKYYLCMKDSSNVMRMFVFDTKKGIWHKEDGAEIVGQPAVKDNVLYWIDASDKKLYSTGRFAEGLTEETAIEWFAESGLMGYDYVERKYVSRFNLRMKLPRGSSCDLWMQYDDDGIWHHAGHMEGKGTQTFLLPVQPRRCDHFRFRLTGTGEIRLYSIAKIHAAGSDEQ